MVPSLGLVTVAAHAVTVKRRAAERTEKARILLAGEGMRRRGRKARSNGEKVRTNPGFSRVERQGDRRTTPPMCREVRRPLEISQVPCNPRFGLMAAISLVGIALSARSVGPERLEELQTGLFPCASTSETRMSNGRMYR